MTFPWQIHIGDAVVPMHAILEAAGIFIGFRYFLYLRKKQTDHIATSNRIWILIGAMAGAVIGSRLVGGLENPEFLLRSSNLFWHFYSNKTILGGLLGGTAGVELTKLLIQEKTPSGDLFTFPIILAMIIGRVGCFSMGIYEETYGVPSPFPMAMDLGDGILRHPVALYEIVFLIMVWTILTALKRKYALAEGALFKIFMISYLLFRLMLDFIKPRYTFSIGLSTIQLAAIAGLVYYSAYIVQPKKLLASHA